MSNENELYIAEEIAVNLKPSPLLTLRVYSRNRKVVGIGTICFAGKC